MNSYIRAHFRKLPLLERCHGPDTQEDGIIRHILNQLNVKSSFLVEFGQRTLGAGTLGRIAQELRYSLLNIDAAAIKDEDRVPWEGVRWTLRKRSVSPLNINAIFDECHVPADPAVCVVDVDGMDYWCMLAILQKRRPAVIICEYNCHIPAGVSASLAFDPMHEYQKTKNYGASYAALVGLANAYRYRLVHVHGPLNLYFIAEEQLASNVVADQLSELAPLAEEELRDISDTDLFYDSFHPGKRPSWYSAADVVTDRPPWIGLDKIGDNTSLIAIDEIKIQVYDDDKGGSHYRQRGHKEDSVSPLWRLMRHHLSPEWIIDIGANYGFTSVLLANRLGAKRVIAVEPDPRLLGLLRTNLQNNLNAVKFEVVHAAISGKARGVTTMGINPTSTQDNRVVAARNWSEIVVSSKTLDDILEPIPLKKRLFIKSDTQGFDVNVIRSGYAELSKRRDWVLRCEFAPAWMESQGFSPTQELEWLCCNFGVFEAPLRASWNARFTEVFLRPLEASHAAAYVDYVTSLNHNRTGWVDLYVFPRTKRPSKS